MRMDPSRMRRTTWWAVIGYVLVASGLPLPGGVPPTGGDAAAKRLSAKDRSRPFPCMDKPCGCASAEQCFTNCCCNTPAELLAWARARQVDPAVIVALSRRAAASGGATSPSKQVASCCSTAARPACCAVPPVPDEPEAVPVAVPTVVLRAMLACGGIVAEWLAVGGSLPPPPVVACDRGGQPAAALTLFDESSLSERRAPEGPPPRAS